MEAHNEFRKIQNKASEINQAFRSGQAIVNCVMDGIGFEGGKVQLGFDYEIQKLTDMQDMPSEVAFWLEYERKKALENYEKL